MSDDAADAAAPPDPDELPCDGCGHVWFAGERHHGYAADPEDPDAQIVLCALCWRRRRLSAP